MKRLIWFAIPFALFSCGPAQVRSETVDINRDSLWNRCSFHVIDHECGMIEDADRRLDCNLTAQANYIATSPGLRSHYLRSHGCPTYVISL
jgi:hypothetical protein